MLEAATSWVAVAHANAASAKAGKGSARSIGFRGGEPRKIAECSRGRGVGVPASEAHNAEMRSEQLITSENGYPRLPTPKREEAAAMTVYKTYIVCGRRMTLHKQ